MTQSEFLVALREIRDQFDWVLQADTDRPDERRTTPRGYIRGTLRSEAEPRVVLDPLRAVCYARTGRILEYGAWSAVTDSLNMDLATAAVLLAAANDRTWSGAGDQRTPAENLLVARRELLDAVGLAAGER